MKVELASEDGGLIVLACPTKISRTRAGCLVEHERQLVYQPLGPSAEALLAAARAAPYICETDATARACLPEPGSVKLMEEGAGP